MVSGNIFRAAFLAALCSLFAMLSAGPGFTENVVSVDLRPMLTFAGMPEDDDLIFTGLGDAGVTFSSKGNKNVKAELDLELTVGENTLFDVSRAYIKVRFPRFRSVLGKNRISWGEGVMFNAGDLIAPSSGFSTDLTQSVFHDAGVWMVEGYIPLGRFAFAEIVVLPPVPTLFPIELTTFLNQAMAGMPGGADGTTGGTPAIGAPGAASAEAGAGIALPSVKETALGGRIYLKPLGIKTEAGYLFEGAEKAVDMKHRPYLSLQWHLLVDWQVSASTTIPGEENAGKELSEEVLDSTEISWGIFHMHNFRSGGSISLRLESMVRPAGSWEPIDHSAEDGTAAAGASEPDAEGSGSEEQYGILLYPEIVISPTTSLSFIGRSVFSPIDASGLFTVGTSWNVYQGFTLLGFVSLQGGGPNDLFGWDRAGDFTVNLGMEFAF